MERSDDPLLDGPVAYPDVDDSASTGPESGAPPLDNI
jgi:hypothetical protein